MNDSVRRQLLEQAVRTVSIAGESALNVDEVATLAEVDASEARTMYPDSDALAIGVREFVTDRFLYFVEQELEKLPPASPALDKIQAVAHGYYAFSQSEEHNYGAYINMGASGVYHGFDTDFTQDMDRPSYNLVMQLTREAIIEAGGPKDGWLLLTAAAALWATMHGYCHLATNGVARFLNDAPRKQTMHTVIRTIIAGVTPALSQGLSRSMTPINYVGPVDFEAPPRAKDMPRESDADKRKAIWRGAVEQAAEGGLPSVTLARAAERAGFERSEATRLLDGTDKLLKTLEEHLDEADQSMIGAQVFMVKENSCALSYLKAIGYGYVGYALSDPDAFKTLIAVSSGAIVPASFEINNFETSDMGQAFTFLMEITRKTIEEGDGPRSAWDLFTQVFALWSTAHGLAHLYSAGALHHLDNREKFLLLGPSLDLIAQGMINHLGLKLPNLEYTDIIPEHRVDWN